MAKSITTFTKTVTVRVPFHFTCNYCGRRNDQVLDVSGGAAESRRGAFYGDASGTHMDLQLTAEAEADLLKELQGIDSRIQKYGERLREGKPVGEGRKEGLFSGCLLEFHDVTCAYCGKKQAWGSVPESSKVSLGGCLIPLVSLFLGFAFFGAAAAIGTGIAAAVIGILGFAVLIGGLVFSAVLSKRKSGQSRTDASEEPNDPDNLPVLDVQDIGRDSDIIPDDDRLDSPAKITLIRDSSFVYNGVKPEFRLNSKDLGRLANGESISAMTERKHNILYAADRELGNSFSPFAFEIASGGEAEIHFKATKFLPDQSTGITPLP